MSWKFPKNPVLADSVAEIENINDSLRPFAEETYGRLNEHNWASITQATANGGDPFVADDVAEDGVFVYHSAGVHSSYTDFLAGGAVNAQDQDFASWSNWTALDSLTLSITCPQTLLWVHGSCQIDCGSMDSSTTPSVRLAIRVDGAILLDSVAGTAECDNDGVAGMLYPAFPLSTSFVVPVASGEHKIDLVVKTSGVSPAAVSSTAAYVRSRELICLEMRR